MSLKVEITTITRGKQCQRCKNRPVAWGNKATLCSVCRASDPNRNYGRDSRTIIVHLDSEGDGKGHILCGSFGREDGTSGTLFTRDGAELLLWWIDNVTVPWDGNRQITASFHFNYDAAVLSKWTNHKLDSMELIHKANARNTNLLCRARQADHDARACACQGNKIWYRDTTKIRDVITSGGEGDLIAFDPETCLAIAATPKRRFYVEHRPHGDRYEGYRALDIHDHGTAFIGGLEKVISDWRPKLTDEQRSAIAWGKQARKDNLFNEPPAEVAAYSEAECVAAARCSRALLSTIGKAAGIVIHPSKLFGSGSLALAAFDHHEVPTRKQSQESTHDWIATMNYFGGLIETPVVGKVLGNVDEEDQNSAYPSVMIHLSCMRNGHGHWETITRPDDKTIGDFTRLGFNNYTVGHVNVSWKLPPIIAGSTPPFMVRDKDGLVYQPLTGQNVWVTMPEFLAGIRRFNRNVTYKQIKDAWINTDDIITAGGDYFHHAIKVNEIVHWVADCECPPPLAFLQELYDKRLEIKLKLVTLELQGREGDPAWWYWNSQQNAIKLVINSCYGKLAQRRPTPGKYTNLHLAAMTTGNARAKVRERTWHQEDQGGIVVYQHTDSVLSIHGKPEHQGDGLGVWGLETQPSKLTVNPVILQPGLMHGLLGGKTASRGVGKTDFYTAVAAWAETTDFTQPPVDWPALFVPTRRMVSRRMAIHRNAPETAGVFEDGTMEINIGHTMKRQIEAAYRVSAKKQPSMWTVPPIVVVEDPATLKDIEDQQAEITEQEISGDFDDAEEYESEL
jgi:hypothetical protein